MPFMTTDNDIVYLIMIGIIVVITISAIYLQNSNAFTMLGYTDYVHSTVPGISLVLYGIMIPIYIIYAIGSEYKYFQETSGKIFIGAMWVTIVTLSTYPLFLLFNMKTIARKRMHIKPFYEKYMKKTNTIRVIHAILSMLVLLAIWLSTFTGNHSVRYNIIVLIIIVIMSSVYLSLVNKMHTFITKRQTDG